VTSFPQNFLLIIISVLLCTASISASESKPATQETPAEDNTEDSPPGEDVPTDVPENAAVKQSEEDLKDLEDELQMESANRGSVLLDTSDKVMDLTHMPLTYIQENVPFLTKRNIIFFGRLEVDGAAYSSGVLGDDDGFSIRRFRLGLAGRIKIWPGWNYKVEVDLTDGENSLSDAYLSWRSEKWGTFRIGNQKVAQTLSGQTSTMTSTFMERPLPILAFTLQRRLGVGWDTRLKKVGANLTVFAADPNNGIGSQGWAARGYFNPTKNLSHVFHLGGSFLQISTDGDAQFSARPESYVTNTRLVDTGTWSNVGTSSAVGLEMAGSRGPVTLKSEFYRTKWSLPDSDDPAFKGWYAEASWFLTGEMANYRDGRFIRPDILGDRGAWELAVRFSTIDLNDGEVQGGKQKNLAFSVNWYSKTHWRFMANLIKVKAKDGPYGKQDPWIAQFRAQYYF